MMSKEKWRVPKLRFPGFTEDWEQRKLGDLAEIVRGASPRPISDPKWFDNDSSVGWLRIADVTAQDGRIRYLEQKISELGQEKTRVIKTPHLLLSIAATVGKPVINYVPTGVHDGFLIFLNPKFNILYTFWWLEMFREKWNKYGQPGSQVNLNSDLVKNQVINIPNEKEQEKISSFLESLDKIITLHQHKLDNLKLKKKALLQKLFPKNGERYPELRFPGFTDAWEQRKFSDLYEKISEKNDLSYSLDKIISVANMYYKSDAKVSNEEYLKTYNIFRYGEIAFEGNKSKDFAYGRFVENTIGDGIISHVFEVFRPISKYDIYFWKYYINYEPIMGKVLSRCTKKTTMMTNLVGKDFLKETVLVPTLAEQKQIGTLLNALDKSITLHQRKLDHLQLQKKALLQQMFV